MSLHGPARGLLLVLVLIAISWPVLQVADHASASQALPQWDMAKYGLAGLELADAIRKVDILGFLAKTSSMSSWPPGFPLLEAPVFLLWGAEYRAPRLFVCSLFFLTLLAAIWAGTQLDEKDGLAAGIVLAGLLAGSPLYQVFASLVLLEIPGALLLLLAAGSYFRALRLGSDGSWRCTAVFTTALFFCKYNYGLMWLAPLGISELWRRMDSWRNLEGAVRRVVDWAFRHKVLASFLGVYLFLLGWIRLSGGIDDELLGVRLKATSIGNPVYFLYLLCILLCLLRPRRSLKWLRSWLAGLDAPQRTFFHWLVLPIGLWMLIPPHTKDFFGFVENRSSGLPFLSLENFLFYPRVLAQEYTSWPILGMILLGAAILPCLNLANLEVRRRALCLAVLCHGVAIGIHPYKLPRFAFTLVPLLWLLAAWLLVRALREGFASSPMRRGAAAAALICSGFFAVGTGWQFHGLEVERQWRVRTVQPAVAPLLDRVAELAVEEEGTLLLGTWNLLSPSLVEWHFRSLYPDQLPNIPRTVRPSSKARRRATADLATTEQVILVEPSPTMTAELAAVARQENTWFEPLVASLGSTHRLVAEEEWERSGYVLRLFKRRI